MSKAAAAVVASYVLALATAVGVFLALPELSLLWRVWWADVAATLIIFGFSVAYDNSSFYDPYWSLVTVPIALAFWWSPEVASVDATRAALVLGLVSLYAFRLTFNWARGWQGLGHEDWRYVNIRAATGRLYWPASLLGIHGFPTVQTYLGCLPLYAVLVAPARDWNVLDFVAALVTAGGIAIEAVADQQLRRFAKSGAAPGSVLDTGLWSVSRHPNYFGEMCFWWGLFLFALAANPALWWTGAGAVAITLMFVFASLPMIEKRMLERRPAFQRQIETTSLVIPWFQRRGPE
ncbi:MAG: DUF1295 domain-containing protein [Proteobacteria bacterium]|nr:DUF1295 domain-containing protein [Pseudomonadota bacterium]